MTVPKLFTSGAGRLTDYEDDGQQRDILIDLTQGDYVQGNFMMTSQDLYDHMTRNVYFDYDYDHDVLLWCFDVLKQSETGLFLLKNAIEDGWCICLDHNIGDTYVGSDAHLDAIEKIAWIAVRVNDMSAYDVLFSLVCTLRDIAHENRYGGFDQDFGIEDVMLLSRIRAADCDSISVLVAWELRDAGYPEFWRMFIASEKHDMAVAFSRCLDRQSGSQTYQKALLCAFDQWFFDEERVNVADHQTLQYLDDVLSVGGDVRKQTHKRLITMDVEALSCLHDKTAYLQGVAQDVRCKPLYAGLNDTINQAHFMQILRDQNVTYVCDIPFRDSNLAARIFPDDVS